MFCVVLKHKFEISIKMIWQIVHRCVSMIYVKRDKIDMFTWWKAEKRIFLTARMIKTGSIQLLFWIQKLLLNYLISMTILSLHKLNDRSSNSYENRCFFFPVHNWLRFEDDCDLSMLIFRNANVIKRDDILSMIFSKHFIVSKCKNLVK